MRNVFASTVIDQCNTDKFFFLTGDLGFMALEEVRSVFKERFINMGVSEQNMHGVAAGIAREGYKVFTYSIAPFSYARSFEQIRNDICFNQLPVCIVANGGGYAYGYMGPTHHALEDCAAMSALGLRVLVPAFNEDIPVMLSVLEKPVYLRLGYDERPDGTIVDVYAPWRKILTGENGVLVALGPLAGIAWKAFLNLPASERPEVWAVTEFDTAQIPDELWTVVSENTLYVVEEHVKEGGIGMHLALVLLQQNISVKNFIHRYALRYPSGHFGSQSFHRNESLLDARAFIAMIRNHS